MFLTKQKKQEIVQELVKDINSHATIAIASSEGLPSRQYNAVMKKTRGKAKFDVARLTLIKRAIEASSKKDQLKQLEQHLGNASVLVVSSLDAFKLYKLFKQSRSKSGAKPGAIAPMDIVIPAGETNLAPGPVLTELKQAKIDAKIQGPKVVISKDALVAKKGEAISDAVSKILNKLAIEPMEVGMNVLAVYDNGTLYLGSVLDVDEEAFKQKLALAYNQALNLCVFAEVYNNDSTPAIIAKASREANALQKLVEEKNANKPETAG